MQVKVSFDLGDVVFLKSDCENMVLVPYAVAGVLVNRAGYLVSLVDISVSEEEQREDFCFHRVENVCSSSEAIDIVNRTGQRFFNTWLERAKKFSQIDGDGFSVKEERSCSCDDSGQGSGGGKGSGHCGGRRRGEQADSSTCEIERILSFISDLLDHREDIDASLGGE